MAQGWSLEFQRVISHFSFNSLKAIAYSLMEILNLLLREDVSDVDNLYVYETI